MMKVNISFWHVSILILIQAINSSTGYVVEKWIEQPLDHSDPYNKLTWRMRYYENDDLFKAFRPMFIRIGGEGAIGAENVKTGFMFDVAEICGAMLYQLEHRYYGLSRPVPDTTFENLKYLSIEQALADIAFFIVEKKRELEMPNIPVILFGCSYAGSLAAWMRIKYPNLVHGAVAVSAPIYIKTEYPEFHDVVADALRKYDENCMTIIKEGFSELEERLRDSAVSSVTLQNDFNLCDEPDLSQDRQVALMVSLFAQVIGRIVLSNTFEQNRKTSIANLCTRITENNENRSSYHSLARIISKKYLNEAPCSQIDYDTIAKRHAETSWNARSANNRLWTYQTCTELGHKPTFSPNSIFGSRVSLPFFMKICADVLGEDYRPDVLEDNVKRINSVNNAGLSNATNIIFINGDLDPWHLDSVLHDLNDHSPAILIPDTTHCEFLDPKIPDNYHSIYEASCKVTNKILNFIDELY